MKKLAIILFGLAGILSFIYAADAATYRVPVPVDAQPLTKYLFEFPVNVSSTLQVSSTFTVSSLGSSGNPCVTVSTVGLFATSTCGSGAGTVTTSTANTAGQIAIGDGGSAIRFSSSFTAMTSTNVLAAPTGTFSGTVSVATTTISAAKLYVNGDVAIGSSTDNGLISATNASGTVTFKVSSTTGATSSAVSLNVLGNASTSPAAPVSIFQVLSSGHINSTGTIPTVSACGSGSPSVKGSDSIGTITLGTGGLTSCKLTFQIPYESSNVVCMATDSSSTDAVEVTTITSSSATFGFSLSIAGGSVYYMCGENF